MAGQVVRRWTMIGSVSMGLLGVGSVYTPAVVDGQSMAPTFQSGQLVWVDRTHYLKHQPERGDVVIFRHDGETYIKRVYRAPGERVTLVRSDGDDIVDIVRENKKDELREMYKRMRSMHVVDELVPEDSVWVLGDNYHGSDDTRHFGPVPLKNIIGRVRAEQQPFYAWKHEMMPRLGVAKRVHGKSPQHRS